MHAASFEPNRCPDSKPPCPTQLQKRGVNCSPDPPLGLCLTRQLLRLTKQAKLLSGLQIHRVAFALDVQLRGKADDKAADLGGRALRNNRRDKLLREVRTIRASAQECLHMQNLWGETLLRAHLTSKLMSPLPSASIVSKNPCTWLARYVITRSCDEEPTSQESGSAPGFGIVILGHQVCTAAHGHGARIGFLRLRDPMKPSWISQRKWPRVNGADPPSSLQSSG